ncbi:MAG: carboxylating nicotinate-nucleotide diphosphorylase [Acidobacteria bacterium]|nr:carboxylating nicotinate-nucleotide diphosphorylase [Acidobacteriota bacterium]
MGLSSDELRDLVGRALKEDLGAGDLTTRLTIPEGTRARGVLVSKQDLVVAGLPVAAEVFRVLDPLTGWEHALEDGAEVPAGVRLAAATGTAATLLAGERVALNFIQHLSGIATQTRRLKAKLAGLKTQLLDTRKTIPGLRMLEKYAVRVGGGANHRRRLDDGILIKNNHLRLAGGISQAVERARKNRPQGMEIEVEVRSFAQLDAAINAGAERVLLDNMTSAQVRECVLGASGRVRLEVSGGVNAANIREYAETGVDYISVGALTHSAPAADVHFLIEPV